jgi:putative drug exporter of the RND superfamily
MPRLPLPARRPWLIVGAWAVAVAGLALLGTGIAARLAPTSLLVPGSPSAQAHAMLDREFGNQIAVTVLLEGPPKALDRQGPHLAAALARERQVRVMSPWQRGGGELAVLRPRPGAALIIASFQRPEKAAMSEVVPATKRIVANTVRGPVHAYVGGVAAIATALQENALAATKHAELLVAPILVIVLLLVFRSPLAAAIPLLMGAATVAAGRGLLLLSTYAMPVNAIAVAMASMMGLALGVDYALLMVSRFRQEREGGATSGDALATAAAAAGRTIVFAGGTLSLVMVTAAFVAPGDLLSSVAAGVVVSTLLSVLLAVSLLPALLAILAPHLERWRLPSKGRGDRLLGLAGAAIARPWIAIPAIVVPMLAIAAPALALNVGPPDPRQLPPSDPTRQGFDALRKAIGPGWAAPIAVIATAKQGPISAPKRLEAISRWQNDLAHDPDVAAVIGPASLQAAEAPLRKARRAYREAPAQLAQARHSLASLSSGLRRASNGVEELRRGLGEGAGGASRIARGTREAESGAGRLGGGLQRASDGARRLSGGASRIARGAHRLLAGQRRLSAGTRRLAGGLRRLDRRLRSSLGEVRALSQRLAAWSAWLRSLRVPTELAAARLESGLAALDGMTVGREDPRYPQLAGALREAAALVGVPPGAAPQAPAELPGGVPSSVAAGLSEIAERAASSLERMRALPEKVLRLSSAVGKLRRGSGRVDAGAGAARRGAGRLSGALVRLRSGSRHLARGLAGARGPTAELHEGLGKIAAGAERLSGGLQAGRSRSGKLAAGLRRPQEPLRHYGLVLAGYQRDYGELQRRSPGAIDSGYLLLSALDGTVPGVREQVSQLVNLDRGGRTVRMLVVPKSGPSSSATRELGERVQRKLPALARASGTEAAVGEGAQSLADYTNATMDRMPWLVFALCFVSAITLIAVLRSLLLPIVAVALNALTIAAAFGALQLFFGAGLLVGPHYIDAISAAGVMTIMFVLSIDYEVFLLTRMREIWLEGGDHELAIAEGLASTAGVITGAATVMCSVFFAFATAEIASLQQFGAGLAFAVILDATVVRLVLLPALMRALGPRAWWLPAWLDRLIPEIEHGAPARAAEPAPVEAVPETAAQRLEAAAHEEHQRLLELLAEVEQANERHEAGRVITLVEELRRLAQAHFSYEQSALFPHLAETVGVPYIAELQAAQGSVVEALVRIEELAGPATVRESAATETRRLLRSARHSVISCDALCEAMERQSEEVAEAALAARERALAAHAS